MFRVSFSFMGEWESRDFGCRFGLKDSTCKISFLLEGGKGSAN